MGKSQVIKKIYKAANDYRNCFVGKTFMYIFGDKCVEVIFKKSSFLHLTGVKTNLNAEDFFNHAIKKKGLHPHEVQFDNNHPYDLANKKTEYLSDLFLITTSEVVIASDIVTKSYTYSLGLANSKFVVCLGENTGGDGKKLTECKVPYSFRIENIIDEKTQVRKEIFPVTHILKKKTGEKKYRTLLYGSRETLIASLERSIEKSKECVLIEKD